MIGQPQSGLPLAADPHPPSRGEALCDARANPAPGEDAAAGAIRQAEIAAWKAIVAKYQIPHRGRAWWQIINTIFAYAALWVAMYFALKLSWWLVLPLLLLATGLLIRVFIIFHDCGHGSFFRSRAANTFLGFLCGMLTFTPYHHWWWEHAVHHATAGDLDRRGVGDVWTMTVSEYLASSLTTRFFYRLTRNPAFLFVVAPVYLFIIGQRVPSPKASLRERMSVWWMNLAILGMAVGMSHLFGFVPYLIIQLSILIISGSAGIWLFYVQHQFEGVYWERTGDWEYTAAALQGSSYYKLPKILQWFSGNIGFHHIHHLSPRIPNYNLERCHRSDPLFHEVPAITLFASLRSLSFRLWDEAAGKLVSFRALRKLRAAQARETKEKANAAPANAAETQAPPAHPDEKRLDGKRADGQPGEFS